MNNSSILANPVPITQFLSVANYLTTLSLVFYGHNSTTKNQPIKTLPIVNSLFEYLNQSNDEMETKRSLARRLLQGTDLYGGNENETLDEEYINVTFDYIVSKAVFSKHYGTINGYLASIVNSLDDLKLSNLKSQISRNLLNWQYQNDDCSVSHLSSLSVERILETLIWPSFPQPERDMKIIDVDYMYAQAGLIFSRSVLKNFTNLTFNDYISISQSIELSSLTDETIQPALQIFSLPASLYYAHVNQRSFQEHKAKYLMKNEDFWTEAFFTLFSHLNQVSERINQISLEESPAYQFSSAMEKFRSRTKIAEEILREECPQKDNSSYESAIDFYKLFASSTYCIDGDNEVMSLADIWLQMLQPPGVVMSARKWIKYRENSKKQLPNVDDVYSSEVDNVTKKYRSFMKVLIRKRFEEANLADLIDSPNTTVYQYTVKINHELRDKNALLPVNTTLFAINHQGVSTLYALVNNLTDVTLIRDDDDHELFINEIKLMNLEVCKPRMKFVYSPRSFHIPICDPMKLESLYSSHSIKFVMHPSKNSKPLLKGPTENFDDFLDRISDLLAETTRKQLHAESYDEIFAEKLVRVSKQILFSFIPFYDCIKAMKAGETEEAILPCTFDIVGLIPFGAQLAKLSWKLNTVLGRSIKAAVGASLRTLVTRRSLHLAFTAGLRKAFAKSGDVVYKTFISKQMFKGLSIGLVRSLDPGFELLGRSAWKGTKLLSKLGFKMSGYLRRARIGGNVVKHEKLGDSLEIALKILSKLTDKVSSSIKKVAGHEVFRDMYPGGMFPYGPEYVRLPDGVAEMRRMSETTTKIPVVVSRTTVDGELVFRKIDLKTGEISGLELQLNGDGLLETVDGTKNLKVKEDIFSEYINSEGFYSATELEIPPVCRIWV